MGNKHSIVNHPFYCKDIDKHRDQYANKYINFIQKNYKMEWEILNCNYFRDELMDKIICLYKGDYYSGFDHTNMRCFDKVLEVSILLNNINNNKKRKNVRKK